MGGISAQTGKRQGEAGAIVFGGVRDVAHSRARRLPGVVDGGHAGHRQMAHRDRRDQRRDRSRGRARRAGRHRVRRRHRRVLHPARRAPSKCSTSRARKPPPRKPSARRSTPARPWRTCPRTRDAGDAQVRPRAGALRRTGGDRLGARGRRGPCAILPGPSAEAGGRLRSGGPGRRTRAHHRADALRRHWASR